jgi:uncharacterized membrane protein
MKTINIKEAVVFGWETFKKNMGFLMGLTLLMLVIFYAIDFTSKQFEDGSALFKILLQILFAVFSMLIGIGMAKIYLKVHDGQQAPFSELINHSELLWKYFVGEILYALIVVGGLILLVVPGIYWAIKYMYTQTLIVDKGMDPFLALKKSGEMTKDIKWSLILLIIVLAVISVLGFLALGIGMLVTIPVVMLAHIHIYKHLLHSTESVHFQAPAETSYEL